MRALLLFLILIPPSFSIICPPQYTLVGGVKCLKLFWTPATHWEAEQNCTSISGTLVTIKNEEENQLVWTFAYFNGLADYPWIGLSCFGNTTSTCFWDDGSGTPYYENFMNFPRDIRNGNCVFMSSLRGSSLHGKWGTAFCENVDYKTQHPHPFICETPTTIEADKSYNPYCNYNYNGYCYVTSQQWSYFATTMNDAANTCKRRLDENLVSIHSKMELDFIRNIYKANNVSKIYLGAQADSNGRFFWLDGSDWNFDYMDPLSFQRGKCLVMDVQEYGLWSQVDCDEKFEFLCKQKITETHTAASVTNSFIENSKNLKKHVNVERETLFDASNCNSTVYLAPGSISTFGYPDYSTPPSYCSWRLVALGPYRIGIYFDFWATNGEVNILDEFGNNIGRFMGTFDRTPFPKYTPFNIATVTFQPIQKPGVVDRGFHAVILPL